MPNLCVVIQTWSRSDIVLAVPVLAAALARTLSGTGVNLEGKKTWCSRSGWLHFIGMKRLHFLSNKSGWDDTSVH